jgi:RNA recognition motif-containing protein
MAGNAAGPTALFVGDLSSICTEEDLNAAFSQFGVVRHVRIQRSRDKVSGQRVSAGYGFVKMNDIESAQLAMERVNGTCIAGRNVRVKSASHHAEDSNKQESKMSIYVKFVGCTVAATTDESVIREVFSQFGTVEDVTIRKQFADAVS